MNILSLENPNNIGEARGRVVPSETPEQGKIPERNFDRRALCCWDFLLQIISAALS
ncbi:hypothetical protein HYU14_00900 [Candidatus Woesearchaeota archaeon]|nr:hypothetical protein [Candidatus Woesearchaeota archaeon]